MVVALVLGMSAAVGTVSGLPPAAATTSAEQHHTEPSVLINELANGGSSSDSDTFVELRNWGTRDVDLSGWHLYRCSAQGLRSNAGREEGNLNGVVLRPGELYTVSRVGMPGDAHVTAPFMSSGFGLYLEGPDGELVDGVGVYANTPWPTESECTVGTNLPNSLSFAHNESWQRVAATGDVTADFVAAPATVDEANVDHAPQPATERVRIAELALAGPAAADDEFLELENAGPAVVDIGGWRIFRCTATGRLRDDTLQLTVPHDTALQPGERWVVGGRAFTGDADARWQRQLADVSAGIRIETEHGALVDRVSISAHADSACQDGDDKLPAVLDAVAGESYQRTVTGFVVAPRSPGRPNATVDSSVFDSRFDYGQVAVAVSEIATDPSSLPGGGQRNFIELGNYGSRTVDIGGWTIRRCEATGVRSRDLQSTIPIGTTLAPGAVFVAAKAGTPAAAAADVTYATSLNMLGAGVWVENAEGVRVDSVGVFEANEMDAANVVDSPCTKGRALTTYAPDRLVGETFQRSRFTGVDADDFVIREATPGSRDLVAWIDPLGRVATEVASPTKIVSAKPAALSGEDATVLGAWSGVSDAAPPATRVGAGESRIELAASSLPARDDAWGFPYQRLLIDAGELREGSTLAWRGETTGSAELQLWAWDHDTAGWTMLDAATGPEVTLVGVLTAGHIVAEGVTVLVQAGPRTEARLAETPDGRPEDPAAYDLAISHITDTQYLSETYPAVYADLVSWIADNSAPRKIAFATHTGDLVQNWVDPAQNEVRARVEFERASAIQSILDDAGVANSVLPGNHDNKRGVTNDLYNEYFGPDRYADAPTYGGSIAPGDNSANYSTFEREGARFLMLSLPYAYGDREIDWASEIVTSHADHNVILSTHEHLTPKLALEQAKRSTSSRWVSRADDLWNEVVAPNRNVVLVLSGHFHGLGQIVTDNAGGIEGHRVVELLADYQEFRTHTGERATGFQRLLQVDLAAGTVAVDTLSNRLAASASHEYDYRQFVPDNGFESTPSNARPWNIVDAGLQHRYTAGDDEFQVEVAFQFEKSVSTRHVTTRPPATTVIPDAAARVQWWSIG